MAEIRLKRGTRAQVEAAATASELAVAEPYLISDEGRIAIGAGVNTFVACAKQGEAQPLFTGATAAATRDAARAALGVYYGATAPADTSEGVIWLDTSGA